MSEQRDRTLARQLLTWYAIVVLAVLLVLGVVLNRNLERQLLSNLTESLESQALLLRATLGSEAGVPESVLSWANDESLRITVIDQEGRVLADSSREEAGMENHADRPEVSAALAGNVGVASRISASVGVEYRYVAVPPTGDGRIVRVAEPVNVIAERLRRLRTVIALAGLGSALVGVGAVWLIARRIVRPIQLVTESAVQIAAGNRTAEISSVSTVELKRMADTVNQMAGELRRRAHQSDDERLLRDRILDALEEGVILIDADESVAYANTWARNSIGVRKTLAELPGPLQELSGRARSSGEMEHGDFSYGIPARRFIASAVVPGEAGSVLLVLQDVTDALRVEAMRRDFVADASHELKTPISAIQAGSETILRAIDEDPEGARTFAEQVRLNAVRLGRIVGDLLDLSRLETEVPEFEKLNLDEMVRDEVVRIDHPSGKAPVEFIVETEPVEVLGSRNDLQLAVRNLLDNAQRYAAAGEVRVAVRRLGNEAILEVADNGVGIPTRDLPRIFERFYRVDVARSRHTGGTGLGLAIVKHVAEAHGGLVEAKSELGVGSVFRMALPLVDPNDDDRPEI
jgi:two-component system, OmpR family, phosphate regulon sensor histidine kinase PhoR